jgi:hypothetical protein
MKKIALFACIAIACSKLSAQPVMGWVSTAGGGNNDRGFNVVTSEDGNVFTMGTYVGEINFQYGSNEYILHGNADYNNTYVQKMSPNGELLWALGYTGLDVSGVTGKEIAIAPNGNIILLAFFFGTIDADPGSNIYNLTAVEGRRNYCVIVIDVSGNFLWAKNVVQVGEYDDVETIKVNTLGELFIAGSFYDSVDFDSGENSFLVTSAGNGDAFVLKLAPSGNFIWVRTFGASGLDKAPTLCLDPQSNVFISGWFVGSVDFDPGPDFRELVSTGDPFNLFLLKLSTDGDFSWVVHFAKTDNVFVREIASDQSGNIYAISALYGVVDFDPGEGVTELTSAGGSDVSIVKYSNSGNFIWARGVGGDNYEFPGGIVTNSDGEVFCCGSFRGVADFDPGQGVYQLNSSDGWDDIFILKLSADGNLIWAEKTGGPGNNQERCWDIWTTNADEIYFTGQFREVGIFNPGGILGEFQSNGYEDSFTVKWMDSPTSINETYHVSNINLYPNPVSSLLSIQSAVSLKNASVSIYTATGLLVEQKQINGYSTNIDISELAPGIYLLQIKEFSAIYSRIICVQ